MPFISTALGIGLGVAGSIAGGVTAASGAGKQADASLSAAQLQSRDAQQALDFQKQQYSTQQQELQPFLQAGTGAVNTLSGLIPQLNAASSAYPSFTAPTAAQAQATPGYQFQLGQGEQAIQNSAAARGGLLSGNTLNAEQQFGQGLANSTYQQTYQNALQGYQQSYNQFQNNQANQFNRYASLAGVGQTAANTLTSAGQQAAGNVSNTLLQSGAQQGQDIQNAAAAQASGYTTLGNSISGAANNAGQSYLLSQLLKQQQEGSGVGAAGRG